MKEKIAIIIGEIAAKVALKLLGRLYKWADEKLNGRKSWPEN